MWFKLNIVSYFSENAYKSNQIEKKNWFFIYKKSEVTINLREEKMFKMEKVLN